MEKAEEIVKSSANSGVQSTVLRLDKLEEDINRYDILIQTTSVGLSPNINETPISLTSWDGKGKQQSISFIIQGKQCFCVKHGIKVRK